jgi:putative redox protein
MHSPSDDVVPLENAGKIYSALRYPKSFISLAGSDHLLTQAHDAEYLASLISLWASRI